MPEIEAHKARTGRSMMAFCSEKRPDAIPIIIGIIIPAMCMERNIISDGKVVAPSYCFAHSLISVGMLCPAKRPYMQQTIIINKAEPELSPNEKRIAEGKRPITNFSMGLPGRFGITNRQRVQQTQNPERAMAPYPGLPRTVVM